MRSVCAPSHPRIVRDTNAEMALWFFEDPSLSRLQPSVIDGGLALVSRADAIEELRRVLAYRQFGVDAARQAAILARYVEHATIIAMRGEPPGVAAETVTDAAALPLCRDRDDQKFLEIARDGAAAHLVTRDKALLRLDRHRLLRRLFAIVTPEAFTQSLPPH